MVMKNMMMFLEVLNYDKPDLIHIAVVFLQKNTWISCHSIEWEELVLLESVFCY